MPATRNKSHDNAAIEPDHHGYVSNERTSNDVGWERDRLKLGGCVR